VAELVAALAPIDPHFLGFAMIRFGNGPVTSYAPTMFLRAHFEAMSKQTE